MLNRLRGLVNTKTVADHLVKLHKIPLKKNEKYHFFCCKYELHKIKIKLIIK